MSGLLQDLRYALRQLRNAGIRRRSCDYFADVPHRGRTWGSRWNGGCCARQGSRAVARPRQWGQEVRSLPSPDRDLRRAHQLEQ